MARTVLLDAGPLGLVTHPRVEHNREAALWLRRLLSASVPVLVPEISDYEIRRELLRAGKARGLRRLDQLAQDLGYLPITTEVMRSPASRGNPPPPTSPSTLTSSSPLRQPS